MTGLIQIACFYLMASHQLDFISGKPFGEVFFKNNVDVAFKPIPFKPFAFITEKWSPFGKFGMKHGIEKRDLDKIKPRENIGTVLLEKELSRLPAAVYEVEPVGAPVSPPPGLRVVPAPPLVPMGPVPAPTPPVVVITPPPPKVKESAPVKGLNTDIFRDQLIGDYLKSIEQFFPKENVLPPMGNSIVSEKPKEEKEEQNPFIRGSKLALYFGNILVDLLAQFLGERPAQPVNI